MFPALGDGKMSGLLRSGENVRSRKGALGPISTSCRHRIVSQVGQNGAEMAALLNTMAMTTTRFYLSTRLWSPDRRTPLWLALICAVLLPIRFGRCAGDTLPAPTQAYSSKALAIVHADIEAAGGTAIWRELKAKAPSITDQIKSLPGANVDALQQMDAFDAVRAEDIAEVVLVSEAEPGPDPSKMSTNSSFLVVLRLTKATDWKAFLDRLLKEAEKHKSGLRDQIEQSKKRVGAADFYVIPSAAFGGQALPIEICAAAGPGKDGGIIAFGKETALRNFLEGRSEGRLPAGASGLLSQQGQIWFYVGLPESAQEALVNGVKAGGGSQLPPGVIESLKKLRAIGLGANFASDRLGLELAVGCVDAAACQEISGSIQGLLAMAQMSGGQSSAVSKLRLAASGATFRLTVPITVQDLRQAMPGTPNAAPVTASATPVVIPASAPEPTAQDSNLPLAEVKFLAFLPGDDESLRTVKLRVTNRAPKAIKEVNLTFSYFDENGKRLKTASTQHVDPEGPQVVLANATREFQCYVVKVPVATKRVTVALNQAVFSDGEVWAANQ